MKQPPGFRPFSEETKLALQLCRQSQQKTEDLLRSEINDVHRDLDRCVDALRTIYSEYGEDKRIAEICDPLIKEFARLL